MRNFVQTVRTEEQQKNEINFSWLFEELFTALGCFIFISPRVHFSPPSPNELGAEEKHLVEVAKKTFLIPISHSFKLQHNREGWEHVSVESEGEKLVKRSHSF